jgi:hypothetical protein
MPETNSIHNPEFVALAKSAFDDVCALLPPGRDTQSIRARLAECILLAAGAENAIRRVCAPTRCEGSTNWPKLAQIVPEAQPPVSSGIAMPWRIGHTAALYTGVTTAVKNTGPGQISLTQGPDPRVGPSPTHFPGLGPSRSEWQLCGKMDWAPPGGGARGSNSDSTLSNAAYRCDASPR